MLTTIADSFWVLGPDDQPVDVASTKREAQRVMDTLQRTTRHPHRIIPATLRVLDPISPSPLEAA